MTRNIVSVILEFAVALSAAVGVALTAAMGVNGFLYFTVQSNLWVAAVLLVFAVWQTVQLRRGGEIPQWLWSIKFVFTVSITLTGLVFCAVLAPTMKGAFNSAANVLTHVVVPLCSVADLFVAKRRTDAKTAWWSLAPPIYYLGFASLGYVLKWDFGYGANYPYFFLNWGSPVGAFGFGGGGEYFMGTFWWILVMLALVSCIAFLYRAILNRTTKAKD